MGMNIKTVEQFKNKIHNFTKNYKTIIRNINSALVDANHAAT